MTLRARTAEGIKWSAVSAGGVGAIQFVSLAILARLLSAQDFGLIGMIAVVVGFGQTFADMGISNAVIYRQDTTREALSSIYWLNILTGIFIFLCVIISRPLVAAIYREPRLYALVSLAAIIFLITPVGQLYQVLLQKDLQFGRLAVIEITSALVGAVITIVLAAIKVGASSLIYGQLAGTFVRASMLFLSGLSHWRPTKHFSFKDLEKYLSFGLYQMGERTVSYFGSKMDFLLIGALLGATPLGYYTLAYNMVLRPISLVNPIITRVAFPVFSKVQRDIAKLKRGYLKVIQLLSSINFPFLIGMAVISSDAVCFLFGTRWFPSVILVQILALVALFRSISNPIGALLLSRGRADLGFKWNIIVTITQILGLYVGISIGGLVGLAIAYAILMAVYVALEYFLLIRKLIGHCLSRYISSLWPPFWISILMGIAVFFIKIPIRDLSLAPRLIVQIFFGLLIYITLTGYVQKTLVIELRDMFFADRLYKART